MIEMTHAQAQAELIKDLHSFENDPLGWVRWAFEWGEPGTDLENEEGPDAWQERLLDLLGDDLQDDPLAMVRDATASGHGIGKSALVAWIVLWAVTTFPYMRGVVTANTDTQLRTKTWAEVTKWYYRLNPMLRAQFKVTATAVHSTDAEAERTWRIDAVPWSKSNPAGFAGLHTDTRTLIIFDEASEIVDVIWDTMEGANTDKAAQRIWLAFGNPTQNIGRFKEVIAGKLRHQWRHRQVDARTVKRSDKALIDGWIKAWGIDSDFVRVRVLGKFPKTGATQFISEEAVQLARARKPEYISSDPIVFGLDVARHGNDQSVLAVRRGRDAQTIPWQYWREPNLMNLAGLVAAQIDIYKPDAVFIDVTGMGWGVYDRLLQLNYANVYPANFGDPGGETVFMGVSLKATYLVDRIWLSMREWLKGGSIPDSDDLQAELIGRTYGFSADNALRLEAKDHMRARGLASPDAGDALALTFTDPVLPRDVPGFANPKTALHQNDYDPLADARL